MDVYLESAPKRTFAGAIDWPGWCRGARDEDTALEALLRYAPRYARVLTRSRLGFTAPARVSELRVVERLKGTATTDFGAPDVATASDERPVDDRELRRFHSLLKACLRSFDAAVQSAHGKELRKGPRGGGRELEKIVDHVAGSDESYVRMLGWQVDEGSSKDPIERSHRAVLDALTSAVRVGVREGPRGGKRWVPRYFVRRVAWHVLDHAWEIEDRMRPAD